MLEGLAVASVLCALPPCALFCINLGRYRPPNSTGGGSSGTAKISVLIPARNEEGSIGAALASVLSSESVQFEVVVMDDCSTDRTAEIVQEFARRDPRVRLEKVATLPPGWNGKQHACWSLANAAAYDVMCFMDADVRLAPRALARMEAFRAERNCALVSGFPRQLTESWLEILLLPLIHFVLLGFLPISRMRTTKNPAYAAGCGQFLLVQREMYFACGGHNAIRATMHDGLLLPRLFRSYGYKTDLADLTSRASCRMYRNAREVWAGLAKNATEGLAAPARIVPLSLLLLLGQVVPFWLALHWLLAGHGTRRFGLSIVIGVLCAWLPRALACVRFRQDWRGAVLHPVGILCLLAVQWYALIAKLSGRAFTWKDRAYRDN